MRLVSFRWTSRQVDGDECLFEIDLAVRIEFNPTNTRDWHIVELEFPSGLAIDRSHPWWMLLEDGLYQFSQERFEDEKDLAIMNDMEEGEAA